MTDLGDHEEAAAVASLPPCVLEARNHGEHDLQMLEMYYSLHIFREQRSVWTALQKNLETACGQTVPLSTNQNVVFKVPQSAIFRL